MRKIVADLHIHTNRSDGCLSYQQVAEKSKKLGLEYISITDHDTLVNKYICEYFAKNGPKLIIGTELSAYVKDKNKRYRKLDMLLFNYSFDAVSFFENLIRKKTEQRISWLEGFLKKISIKYPKFSLELILDFFSLKNISEVHEGLIFGTLKKLNLLPSNNFEIADFYEVFMAKEYDNSEFIKTKINFDELMKIQENLGGTFSFAHPLHFLSKQDFLDIIPVILNAGIRFIEAYHYKHDQEQTKYLLSFAANNNLGITGGSDFHGRTVSTLGEYGLNRREFDKFFHSLNICTST